MAEVPKRRTPNRWGEGGGLREEILSAATDLLVECGREEDLSLRAVAREVGVAAPSIYLHFKNRSELVETLKRRAYEELVASLREARDGRQGDGPAAAVRAMAHRYCEFATSNPQRYRLMFTIEQAPMPRERLPEHPVWQLFETWIESVAAWLDGQGGRGDERLVAELVWSSIHGLVALAMSLPFETNIPRLEQMVDKLLDRILAE